MFKTIANCKMCKTCNNFNIFTVKLFQLSIKVYTKLVQFSKHVISCQSLQKKFKADLLDQKRSIRQWCLHVIKPTAQIGAVGLCIIRDMTDVRVILVNLSSVLLKNSISVT